MLSYNMVFTCPDDRVCILKTGHADVCKIYPPNCDPCFLDVCTYEEVFDESACAKIECHEYEQSKGALVWIMGLVNSYNLT